MSRPQSRSERSLNSKLERNLATYAVAAGAAGVGFLALAPPAAAEIVYTPAHVRIGTGGLDAYFLDIGHDGDTELSIRTGISTHSGSTSSIGLKVAGGDYGKRIQVNSANQYYAKARKVGGKIGPSKLWDSGNSGHSMARANAQGSVFGPWANVKNRYVAVWFTHDNRKNFGWVRFNVHFGPGLTMYATLTGYAYETIPDKPISAGDEGTGAKSLGHLALGAARRK